MDEDRSKKRVLIITSLFHPEIAANAKRMTHLAEGLKEDGHDVSVITAFPYYSTSRDLSKYKGRWFVKDQHRGIPIIRTYIYSPGKYGNILKRLFAFLSFMISSIFGSLKIKGKADTVITISPPFTSLFSGYVISRIKRGALILDIQDIYPETLIELGFLKNKMIIALLEWIEKFFYRNAGGIAAISKGFRHNFIKKGADPNGVKVISNWVDTDQFKTNRNKGLSSKYSLNGKFVIIFMGTIGFAQGLENVIEAADIIREYQNDIKFIFLGEGIEKEKHIKSVEKYGLSNFIFIPPKPNSEIPKYLSLADACLVYLRKNDLYNITIPCKTYEYMAMGKPIIMGVGGDGLKLIEAANCGMGVEPESPQELAKVILKLYNNRNIGKKMGKNGRQYVIENFKREKVISQYIDLIQIS